MSTFIITSEQLERLIDGIEHDTQREINRVVALGSELPEVVRCRDCKHSLLFGTECRYFAAYEPIAGGDEYEEMTYSVKPDGFCAWGEGRTDMRELGVME